ncbi:MAG TPA: PAS domain S-box protein [Noviherbaspirillum sp.]
MQKHESDTPPATSAGDTQGVRSPFARMEKAYSIRTWLIFLVAACLLPLLAATILLVYYAYLQQRVVDTQMTLDTARALMQAVDRALSAGQGTVEALATSPYLTTGNLAAFHAQAMELQRLRPRNNFVLSDSDGQQLVNTLQPYGSALPRHGNPEQLRRVFDTARPVVSDLYRGGVLQRPVISIDVPVIRNGQVIYDLSIGLFPERLGAILREQRLPSEWVAAIFDSKGIIVARTWEHDRYVGHSGAPELVQRMRETGEGSIETATLEGVRVFSVFSRSAVSNWSVAIGIPRAAIYRKLWTTVAWLVGVTVLCSLAGVAVAVSVGERIATAVRRLRAPAMALGHGGAIAPKALRLKEANEVLLALVQASELLRGRTVERDLAETARQELRQTQGQLEQSEAFLRRIFEEAPNAIILVAPDGRIVRANMEAERIFGYAGDKLRAITVDDLIPQGHRDKHAERRAHFLSHPTRLQMGRDYSVPGRRADGTTFPAEVTLSPLQTGTEQLVIATVRDVTELRRNEERINAALHEKEILLKELYHRVKNNLQVISSMLSLQERAMKDDATRSALEDAAGRVSAIALVHEKLYQSGNLSSITLDAYIADLCKRMGEAAGASGRGISMEVEAEPIQAGLDTAVPLGLLLNELVSNCLKHAFPGERRGRIVVRLEREGDSTLRLTVRDDGVGIPSGMTPTLSPSLGLRLVGALVQQLDGQFSLVGAQGTVASLVFPLVKQERA